MFLGPRKVALVRPEAHYDNTVQAQGLGITRLKFRYSLPSATSCAFVMLLYLGSCPDRTEGELEVSVDKLFDEGGIGNQMKQGDSVSGERGVDIQKTSLKLFVHTTKNSKRGPEFTWEREVYMKSKYPQLFVDRAVEPTS
ncbi:hypothetical protein Tco_1039346 [Tanacetum coccineum]